MRVEIIVPAKTSRNAPLIVPLHYGGAVMRRETFSIPKGHAFLTGLQMYAGHAFVRVIPEGDSNVEWLTDDNRVITKNITLTYDAPSFEIIFKCYNEDDSFPHTFYIDLDEM